MRDVFLAVVAVVALGGAARAEEVDAGLPPPAPAPVGQGAGLPEVDAGAPEAPLPPPPSANAAQPPAAPGEALPPAPVATPSEAAPASSSSSSSAVASALAGTSVGGYGELTYNRATDQVPVIDMRRFVLFVGHDFGTHFRLYSELEVEHAVSSKDDEGEVEVEQAYVDYVHSEAFGVRAGVILMPVGIINQFHEPPTFNGVDRPLVDTAIIPSTWREPGVGVFGALGEDFRYQAYLVDGMRAIGFTKDGIREGHQESQLARARSWAGVARVDWTPLTALDVGGSLYFGSANQDEVPAGAGYLTLGELDVRYAWRGLELRGEAAVLGISGADQLSQLTEEGPIASTEYGLYAEAGYDLMRLIHPGAETKLVPYLRYQRFDTQYRTPAGLTPDDSAETQIFEGGLTYRPISEIAIKADVRRFSHPLTPDQDATWIDVGLGWMF